MYFIPAAVILLESLPLIDLSNSHPHLLVVYPVLTNEAMTTESQRYNCLPGMQEMPSLNMPVQRLKVTILPLDLPCSGAVTYSGQNLTTGKSHGKKRDRFSLKKMINKICHRRPN